MYLLLFFPNTDCYSGLSPSLISRVNHYLQLQSKMAKYRMINKSAMLT